MLKRFKLFSAVSYVLIFAQALLSWPVRADETALIIVAPSAEIESYIQDEVIVKYRDSETPILEITDEKSVEEKIVELERDPNVEYAEPNYVRSPTVISTNDPGRILLWGLDNTGQAVNGVTGVSNADVNAPEAWTINEGTNSTVVVAVIDTGVAYDHSDLAASMWDGSACVDETGAALGACNHGYDFEDDDATPLPTDSSHGTHVAGTIAAAKNNAAGIIGVAPRAKIMALKFGLDTASEIRAIDFAIKNGVKIINASYGGSSFSQAEYDAISRFRAAGGLFVAAAGNGGPDQVSDNNDSDHFYPSDYDLDNIISVAATNQSDNLASFSNYGAVSVDVGAPGTNILSTVADLSGGNSEYYAYYSGTSMATPHVVGLAALIQGYNPELSASQVKNIILTSGDTLPALAGRTVSGKRVNAEKALRAAITDADAVVADTAALMDTLIRGENPDLDHVTVAFINPLPASGSSGSGITWASSNAAIISHNGQTVVRPDFAAGDASVSMTATLRKGAVMATKTFRATVIRAPLSSVATINSFNFAGLEPAVTGIINETARLITLGVPTGTDVSISTPFITITGASISPASGLAHDFTTPAIYTVTADDGTAVDYEVVVIPIQTGQTLPDGSGLVTVNAGKPQVVISSADVPVTVTVSNGTSSASIDFGGLLIAGAGVLPQTTINSALARVSIPAATNVTSASSSWNGVLAAPHSVSVVLPEVSGQETTLGTAIEVGFSGAKLTFSQGVRIVLLGQAGKRAGYTRNGAVLTEISATCSADTQTAGDALGPDGECKIDSGSDMVIWTKHFTTFATYTQTEIPTPTPTPTPAPSGGGGGGGGGSISLPISTPTPIPLPLPIIPGPVLPVSVPDSTAKPTPASRGFFSLAEINLQEGDVVSAAGSSDPDVYIVNPWGYKRLFLNPAIFNFYGHLGGFTKIKDITAPTREKMVTSGLFRNCETEDPRVYGVETTGEDTGLMHWVNTSGDQAVADDPDFFKKVFCINTQEFKWYPQSTPYTSVNQVPDYSR